MEHVELGAATSAAQPSLDQRATDLALKATGDAKAAKAAKANEDKAPAKATEKVARVWINSRFHCN